MYCGKCGATLPEGSTFCPVCGNQIEGTELPLNSPTEEPADVKKQEGISKKTLALILGSLGAVVLIAAGVLLFVIFQTPRISVDLNEIMNVRFVGCEGYGEAALQVNLIPLGEDFIDRIHDPEASSQNEAAVNFYNALMNSSLARETNLKNGRNIRLSDEDRKAIEGRFNVKLVNADQGFTVTGLPPCETKNPFETILEMPLFYGENGDGRVSGNPTVSIGILPVPVRFSKESGLSNGDTVTLTIPDGDYFRDALMKQHIHYEPTSVDVVVSGLTGPSSASDPVSPGTLPAPGVPEDRYPYSASGPKSPLGQGILGVYTGTLDSILEIQPNGFCVYREPTNSGNVNMQKGVQGSWTLEGNRLYLSGLTDYVIYGDLTETQGVLYFGMKANVPNWNTETFFKRWDLISINDVRPLRSIESELGLGRNASDVLKNEALNALKKTASSFNTVHLKNGGSKFFSGTGSLDNYVIGQEAYLVRKEGESRFRILIPAVVKISVSGGYVTASVLITFDDVEADSRVGIISGGARTTAVWDNMSFLIENTLSPLIATHDIRKVSLSFGSFLDYLRVAYEEP